MINLVLIAGMVLALTAVATAIRHVRLAITARKRFVDALSKWLAEDYDARGEVERILLDSPRLFDEDFRARLIEIVNSLPNTSRREILSGLENNSEGGRSRFIASVLSESLAKKPGTVAKRLSGMTLDESEPSPYKTESGAAPSRFAWVRQGGMGFALGVASVLAIVRLGGMDLAVSQQRAPDDESDLPRDLVELQRRAELQDIARLVELLNQSPDVNAGLATVPKPQSRAEAVAFKAMRAVEEGKQQPQEILWRLKQVGNAYMKVGDHDSAQAYLEAASKVASQVDFKDEPWETVLGVYKNLGDLYAEKGDAQLARSFYERSLNLEPEPTPGPSSGRVQ